MVTDEMPQEEAQKLVIAAARQTECRLSDEPAPTVDADVSELRTAIEIMNTEL